MSKKKVIFKPKNELERINKQIDDWILDIPESSQNSVIKNQEIKVKKEEESRFTIVIPTYLHRRIKKFCAAQGITVKTKLTEIFEKEFPQT